MQDQKLVSIVIPTWQRHELLEECLENIRGQTYQNKEIIIVVDGQDERRLDLLLRLPQFTVFTNKRLNLRLIELGRNWSGLMSRSFGIAPLLVGYLAACGEYIMPWCDDERALVSDHIEKLVNLIETEEVDFVYPRVRIWRNGNPTGPETKIIGVEPPEENEITHYMFRASNLWKYGMPEWGTHPVDWYLAWKWTLNGASSQMLTECTFEHRLDQ